MDKKRKIYGNNAKTMTARLFGTISVFCLLGTLASCLSPRQPERIVNINLSIEWKEDTRLLYPDSVGIFPFLKVAYTNNTGEDIYFADQIDDTRWNYPPFRNWAIDTYMLTTNQQMVLDCKAGKYKDYSSEHYFIVLSKRYHGRFEVYSDSAFFSDRIEVCFDSVSGKRYLIDGHVERIGVDMDLIYMCANEAKCMNDTAIGYYNPFFMGFPDDRNYFIFIKDGETHVKYYNISALQMLGGKYDILFEEGCETDIVHKTFGLKKYSYDDSWLEYYVETPLPDSIGEYKLYKGSFNANSVHVEFDASGNKKTTSVGQ